MAANLPPGRKINFPGNAEPQLGRTTLRVAPFAYLDILWRETPHERGASRPVLPSWGSALPGKGRSSLSYEDTPRPTFVLGISSRKVEKKSASVS